MKRFFAVALAVLAVSSAAAQVLDRWDVQAHGYATQGFLYTTQNNIFTMRTSDGSFQWTDAVANISSTPTPKLRIGAQGRYFLFGKYSNEFSLDWAAADYKANDGFGIRAGKVKTPSGLYNEIQDIDPAYIWSLLPQSVYPVSSRSTLLAHNGAVVYGALRKDRRFGTLEYRGWGGQRVIGADAGFFEAFKEAGLLFPNGLSGLEVGGALHWKTPLPGLMVGASDGWKNVWLGKITAGHGAIAGRERVEAFQFPSYFASYERCKVSAAGEYTRLAPEISISFPGLPLFFYPLDERSWYVMSSYKATNKLTAGLYYSNQVNRAIPPGPARFSKDWALAARYDFNQYLYAKAEQHFIDGTAIGYDMDLNPNGLKPDTRLTILKIGVSF